MSVVTVVSPVKNRPWKDTRAFLNSLLCQTYSFPIILVDFGSSPEALALHKGYCHAHGVKLIEVTRDTEKFNHSRALNIGIQQVETPFTITCDADLVFGNTVIAEAARVLTEIPNIILFCQRVDLNWDGGTLKMHGRSAFGTFIGLSTAWLRKVHGYDEYFWGWGGFDVDMATRASQDGLRHVWLNDHAKQVALYHMRHKGQSRASVPHNRPYHETRGKPLVRNPTGWGQL